MGGIGAVVTAEIEKRTGKEARNCVLGHLQRGGSPTTFDRALCSMFGATAVELIASGDFGKMVAFTNGGVGAVKISDAVGRLRQFRLKATWRARRERWASRWETEMNRRIRAYLGFLPLGCAPCGVRLIPNLHGAEVKNLPPMPAGRWQD